MKEPLNTQKLHVALAQALEDLREVEKDPLYIVNMGCWHEPCIREEVLLHCEVCMAGAVMAKRLELPPTTYLMPSLVEDISVEAQRMLGALNYLRSGHPRLAYLHVYPDASEDPDDEVYACLTRLQDNTPLVQTYERDRHWFFADMEDLRRRLEEANL